MARRSETPRVSVLMSVWNGGRYLSEAVSSIQGQSLRDFEFLIYDDGSTDGSTAALERFAATDPRIELFPRPHAGLSVWLREGVERARGEFVARMDADDVARPERLARQVAHLERHSECSALGARVLLVDPDGAPIRAGDVVLEHEAIDARLLQGRGEAIPHPVVMLRREHVLAAGGYRSECAAAQDLDLYLRLAERGRLANLPDTLLEYRQHLSKVSAARGALQRRAVRDILRQAHRRRGLPPPAPETAPPLPDRVDPSAHWRSWAEGAIAGRHLATARKHARAVLRERPRSWRSWQLWGRAWLGLPASTLRRLLPGLR